MALAFISCRPNKQQGALLVAVSVVLIGVGTIAAIKLLEYTSNQVERQSIGHIQQMAKLKAAIAAYVTVNRRLPCPADGSLVASSPNRGFELRDENSASPTYQHCTSATSTIADQKTGIFPWKTLGLNERDVITADLTHYSYRVFSGPTGLSVDNGASMTNCDTDNGPTPDAPLSTSGQCDSSTNNTSAQFTTGKGLTVVTESGSRTDIAYVLIHHGKSNSGAYYQGGHRKAIPANMAVKEFANTQGVDSTTYTATYYATTPSDSVATDDPTYFDDRVEFLSISDLAKVSGLSARDWPDSPVTIESSTLTASIAGNTTTFAGGSATAGGSSGTTLSSNSDGVGVSGGTGGFGSQIRGTDVFTINFLKDYTRIGLVLAGLGKQSSKYEGVTATFKNSSGTTVGTAYLVACGAATSNSTSTYVAFDNISIGSAFRTVELRPNVPTSIKDGGGNDVFADTNFLVNSISTCDGSGATCINTSATITATCAFKLN